jgi:hypothetical protein
MASDKSQYLNRIRSDSNYPTYRNIIGLIAFLGYLFAALNGIGVIIAGVIRMQDYFLHGLVILLGGLIVSAFIFFGARFWREAALILADIGDSVIDANSENQ